MGNGRNQFPFLFANLEHLHHEWDGIVLLEPLSNSFLHHRRREGAKRFSPLDFVVDHGLHVGAAGITVCTRATVPMTLSRRKATMKPSPCSRSCRPAIRR